MVVSRLIGLFSQNRQKRASRARRLGRVERHLITSDPHLHEISPNDRSGAHGEYGKRRCRGVTAVRTDVLQRSTNAIIPPPLRRTRQGEWCDPRKRTESDEVWRVRDAAWRKAASNTNNVSLKKAVCAADRELKQAMTKAVQSISGNHVGGLKARINRRDQVVFHTTIRLRRGRMYEVSIGTYRG